MESLKSKLTTLTISNVTLVIVCALAIYLLRVRQTYTLIPQWRKDLDAEMYNNGRFPGPDEMLLPPIVTDLESDGSNEILLLTNDLHLEVLALPAESSTSKKLPQTQIVQSVRLPTVKDEDGRPSWPVSMATGYLDEFESHIQVRKQIVVVVLDSWDVLCYDHKLQLLWRQKLMDVGQMRENYQVKSMGILVTSHSLAKGEKGSVIVGGSFSLKGHVARDVPREKRDERPRMQQMGSRLHEGVEDPYTHFSTFAMGGTNGTVHWHHLPGDFQSQPQKDMTQYYHWKLALKHGSWHMGQTHWTRFGGNLLQYLPHQWSEPHDTTLDLASLKKSETSSPSDSRMDSTMLTEIIGLDSKHAIGYAYGGLPPHSPQEHIKHPNAIVIHNHQGLGVLDLINGQPLTEIPMPDTKSTYVDLDGDKVSVETVSVDFSANCQAEVSTVYPRTRAVFVGPLCELPSVFGPQFLSNAFFLAPSNVNEDTHLAVPPLVVNRVAPRKGIFSHLMGESFRSNRVGYDSLYLTSTGRLTSYGPKGEFNWQTLLPVHWSEQTRRAEAMGDIYRTSETGEIYYQSFKPSMVPMTLKVYGEKNVVLVMGWSSMVIVDLKDGFISAEHSLPCQPIQKPLVADFNNDGWTDVVVICPTGFVGISLHQQAGYLYMTLVSITVVLVVCLLSWCCTPEHEYEEEQFSDYYDVG